jgi:hypothetical protein
MTRVESDEPILPATAIRTRAVNQKKFFKNQKVNERRSIRAFLRPNVRGVHAQRVSPRRQ